MSEDVYNTIPLAAKGLNVRAGDGKKLIHFMENLHACMDFTLTHYLEDKTSNKLTWQ